MLDDNPNDNPNDSTTADSTGAEASGDTAAPPTVTRTTRKTAARKTTTPRTRKTAAPAAAPEGGDAPEATPEAPEAPVVKKTTRTRTPRKTAAAVSAPAADAATDAAAEATADPAAEAPAPAKKTAARKTTRTRKSAAPAIESAPADEAPAEAPAGDASTDAPAPAKKTAARKSTTRKTAAKKTSAPVEDATGAAAQETGAAEQAEPAAPAKKAARKSTSRSGAKKTAAAEAPAAETVTEPTETAGEPVEPVSAGGVVPLFQAPEATPTVTRRTRKSAAKKAAPAAEPAEDLETEAETEEAATDASAEIDATAEPAESVDGAAEDEDTDTEESADESGDGTGPARRRRRRGGRRRRKGSDNGSDGTVDSDSDADNGEDASSEDSSAADDSGEQGEGTSRRRRRRRRAGEEGGAGDDDDPNTVTKVRSRRAAEDQITALAGSTRLEAKKQRRREGREAGRRRAPIVSEAEFLARREAVDRTMVIRQRDELTQIAVLEDKVLVEHYVARESQTSLIGNVYLGRVQNVLPSMEAAFIDIGKGRNAVLYAGEVNWAALGHKEGQPRKIESVLSSGQSVLVQVTKDPVGHKGARLTSQVSLAGRFLVYVPDGTTSGISRKLPDTERNRLKTLLKEIVPDSAGVIVRTAAEGASEEELTRDVERLKARWEDIEGKARGTAPALLYGEPDLTLKVVRDLFTEDFNKLVIQGDDAWETVQGYVEHVAPDLVDRVEKFEAPDGASAKKSDVFAVHRIDEQIAKGLDRKVWLPSGGSLIIDRTEAMTVVDVNTGKFTGSGGNLEETVTKNNLEAAEEIVRQLRLRDIGGIIVVDFIDMVLESNRDLVVRRLVECLGRDRTRHQVAEVTSLGLVQMTRKRIGTGLLESFSHDCEHCHGRGVIVQSEPVEPGKGGDDEPQRSGRRGRGRGRDGATGNGSGGGSGNGSGRGNGGGASQAAAPSPKDVAAMARADKAEKPEDETVPAGTDDTGSGTEPAGTTDGTEPGVPAGTAAAGTDSEGGARRGSRRGGRSGRGRGAAGDTEPSATEPSTTEPAAGEPAAGEDVATPTPSHEPGTAAVVDGAPAGELPLDAVTSPVPDEEVAAPVAEPDAGTAAEPEKPKVVTRTRRRSASRPAGPPSGVAGTMPDSGRVEPGTSDVELGGEPVAVPDAQTGEGAPEPHVEHVPIKKKGARKR
nr:Rne/Rng family ribonuclease [Nocardioides sediminis]